MKTVAILFLLLITTASLAQTKVASNTSITVTGTVSISDSIRILNLGIAIGLSRCPPGGFSQAQLDSAKAVSFRQGQNQKPVSVQFQTPDSLYILK